MTFFDQQSFSGMPERQPRQPKHVVGQRRPVWAPGVRTPVHEPAPTFVQQRLQPMGGPAFGNRGIGRFYNPSATNGNQFNRPEVKQAVQSAVRSHTRAQYFRRAGFGAAMRYTLGMEQVPSHLQDYLNARTHGRNQGGQHVGPVYAHYGRKTESYQPSHESYYSTATEPEDW